MSLAMTSGGAAPPTGGAAGGTAAPPPDNTLTLVSGKQEITGWTEVQIACGIERMPSSCTIGMTERYPGQFSEIVLTPGDPCVVKIGNDVVITGYIDRYQTAIGAHQHQVVVAVRGKCEDLVDCSAGIYPAAGSPGFVARGMVVTASDLLSLSRDLASPFDIEVNSLAGAIPLLAPPNNAAVQFSIVLTETPFEIIERAARYAAVLPYEGRDGTLILAKPGTGTHSSGFVQGVNVQGASAAFTLDQRYSIYLPSLLSSNQFGDLGTGKAFFPPVFDQAVPRFRPLIVVSEQNSYGSPIAEQRAGFEMQRRRGRSQQVRVTCDSWRDSAGLLWTPNYLARVDIPVLKILAKQWLIAEVVFVRSADRGTVADLVLMPQEAFTVEPSTLQLYDWQVGQDLQGGAAAPGAGNNDPNFNPRAGEGPGT